MSWRLDFSYLQDEQLIYEDAKGKETADYRIKRDTIAWEIRTGTRDCIYREVKMRGKQWTVKEFKKEDDSWNK